MGVIFHSDLSSSASSITLSWLRKNGRSPSSDGAVLYLTADDPTCRQEPCSSPVPISFSSAQDKMTESFARQHRDDKSGLSGWIKKPEWWVGEVEFDENKKRADYVFLGKKWYGVGGIRDFEDSQNRLRNTHSDSSEWVTNLILDDEGGWERVGYFPVKLGDKIEVRAAKRSEVEGKEVWTKLLGKEEMKMVPISFSSAQDKMIELPVKQYRDGKSGLGGVIEMWYPVWEGNDLKRHGHKEGYNCDVLGRGRVETEVIKGPTRLSPAVGGMQTAEGSDPFGSNVDYKAEGYGVNCDYIPYDRYGGFGDYFLIIKGENKEGRSLKVYLHSLEKDQRVILEELLPEGKFEKVFPIEVNNGGGMVLNLETRSFGRVASENVVKEVLLVPAKWGWLRRLKIQNSEFEARTQNSELEIEKVRKMGTGLYVVSLQGKRGGWPILTLSQGYERGWIAIEIGKEGIRKLEHVRVNGWKNGFVLGNQKSVISDQLVVVFYWPQLLEWLGFIGLGGSVIWLLKRKE